MNKRDLILWAVVLAGPLIWLCTFEANFAWSPWTCVYQVKLVLYLVSVAGLALCAASGALAWSQFKSLGREWAGEGPGPTPRSRFMAMGGMALSAISFLVILAQTIPEVVLGACE